MKFWQKIYISIILLFVIFFNGGIFFVCYTMYTENISMEKGQALDEHALFVSILTKEFAALQKRQNLNDESIEALFINYAGLYKNTGAAIEIYRAQQIMHSNVPRNTLEIPEIELSSNDKNLIIRTIGSQKLIYTAGLMPKPFQEYAIVYVRDITKMSVIWQSISSAAVLIGIVVSILLMIVLYPLLRKITNSITCLSLMTDHIISGSYEAQIVLKGNDEISDLARKFNIMSSEISKQLEELRQEADKHQVFTDNLAHEMRTPLTAIYGYTEFMRNARVEEEDRLIFFDYILKETKRLQLISTQLLEMALLRNSEINFEEIKTESLLKQIEMTLGSKIEEKELEFLTEISAEYIYGNETLISSLLYNLLENAIRACDKMAQVILRIYKENDKDIIEVEDNGIGMTRENLLHITEPFYRVDKARSRKAGGAGLGAALCHSIVDCHHGILFYESEVKSGTKVTVGLFTTS